MDLAQIGAVVMDLDGVLWRGDEAVRHAPSFVAYLAARGIPFALATNNSSKAPHEYLEKLSRLGFGEVRVDQVVSSGIVAVRYLTAHVPHGSGIHVLGGDGLRQLVQHAGFVLSDDPQTVRAVVVGIDFALTYDKLKRASYLIQAGAQFIGTNADRTFPLPEGNAPGAGSILALLHIATGVEPLVMGKPNRAMFDAAVELLGISADRTLMIGDRLDTDIAGGLNAGLQTCLVLTGVSQREDIVREAITPRYVFNDLAALQAAMEQGG
jgi:4-nitrophenyl phosphatase